ncbi:hypothetical protein ELH44_22290 [Rhizobium ruizarguesonis]|uniref:hypothetical protein n=1 Tax=Rhizobium ruizarguesonis TaxID=2081791 RepID=UPI00103000DB|nr:hypothetical protein [Rhizobium ruizarguesonis]TBB56257.1 hypothetical protein ELH44_22290 [Rhizobium ruizarguesonis]
MAGFETRYAEAQRLASRERVRKAEQRDRHRAGERFDADAALFARRNAEQRELVHERLTEGYIQRGDRQVGGRWRFSVREMGLRSEDNPVLKYLVTLIPKGGRARASWDKANLAVQCRQKILTLDYPYIELNRQFLAALRVDCDGVFLSPESCVALLLEIVRDGGIPCLPHIIVGDLLPDGSFSRPHFVWLLPQGSAVWRSDDKRCRTGPVKLFDAVARGLAAALLDLGADPAAPTMTGRMKNPLSPFWHTMTPNLEVWPTLTEYADHVDTSTDRAVLTRRAAAVQSRLGLTASNSIFDALLTEARRHLAAWHFGADTRMRGSRAALADHLHEALATFAAASGLSDERVSYVTGKVASHFAAHFDTERLEEPRRVRGRLAHVVDGMTSVAARQAAGGRHAAKANADRTLEKMCAAYRAMGGKVTKSALAEAAGVSRRTVGSRWSDMLAALDEGCAKQCKDKKVGTLPATGEVQRRGVSSDAATVLPAAVRLTSIAKGEKTVTGGGGACEGYADTVGDVGMVQRPPEARRRLIVSGAVAAVDGDALPAIPVVHRGALRGRCRAAA